MNFVLPFSEGNTDEIPTESIPISFLPPIVLSFKLPPNYPSKEMPDYQISCPWLTYSKVRIFISIGTYSLNVLFDQFVLYMMREFLN